MNPFESAVEEGLGTWPAGTVFLAAVSGGADSTAMLAALAALAPRSGFIFHCLHVEHGIRPPEESRGDAAAVSALCESLSVPCRIVRLAPGRVYAAAKRRGLGVEGTARLFRQAAWTREARRAGALRVLTAHTRDDLLETVCMRFLRGSGPEGLAAMPRDRAPGPQGGPGILRPLLALGRSDALRYLEERGIPYRTDSTNDDPAFLRNRIRKRLFPFLDAQFPGWRQSVPALGETQRLTAGFLRAEAEARLPWKPAGDGETWSLSEEAFFAQPGIIREEALFLGTDRFRRVRGGAFSPDRRESPPGPPRRRTVRLFCRSGPAGPSAGKALDLGACRIERRQGLIILSPKRRSWEEGFSLLIKEPGLYKLKGIVIECTSSPPPGKGSFSAALPLALRRRFKDDTIRRRAYKEPGAGSGGPLGPPPGFQYTCISALDAEGVAAFIGGERGTAGFGIIASREENPKPGRFFFSIE